MAQLIFVTRKKALLQNPNPERPFCTLQHRRQGMNQKIVHVNWKQKMQKFRTFGLWKVKCAKIKKSFSFCKSWNGIWYTNLFSWNSIVKHPILSSLAFSFLFEMPQRYVCVTASKTPNQYRWSSQPCFFFISFLAFNSICANKSLWQQWIPTFLGLSSYFRGKYESTVFCSLQEAMSLRQIQKYHFGFR